MPKGAGPADTSGPTSFDADTSYAELFDGVADPQVRYRLGEKLEYEKVRLHGQHRVAEWPKGRLQSIAGGQGVLVNDLKKHADFYVAAVRALESMRDDAERATVEDEEWNSMAEKYDFIPALPDDRRCELRKAYRAAARSIDKLVADRFGK
jgi:hypothetical protein